MTPMKDALAKNTELNKSIYFFLDLGKAG
jgi:hypothetical protein